MGSIEFTYSLIFRLIAVAVIQQSAELLAVSQAWSSSGIWSWGVLRKDFGSNPLLKSFFNLLLSANRFRALLLLQLACALILLVTPALGNWTPAVIGFCLVVTLLTAVRWRGAFNGGSDCMTIVVLLSLSVAALGAASELAGRACLWWISVQICLSFFISGVIKLRDPKWLRGAALAAFIKVSNYGVPSGAQKLVLFPRLCQVISWAIIAFECSFPMALFDHRLALGYIAAAICFQLANFYLFGLNRFLFAWMAAYPALLFCSR